MIFFKQVYQLYTSPKENPIISLSTFFCLQSLTVLYILSVDYSFCHQLRKMRQKQINSTKYNKIADRVIVLASI